MRGEGSRALLHPRIYTHVIFGVSFCLAVPPGSERGAGRRENDGTSATMCPYVLCIPSLEAPRSIPSRRNTPLSKVRATI